jgi:hypothetical protein
MPERQYIHHVFYLEDLGISVPRGVAVILEPLDLDSEGQPDLSPPSPASTLEERGIPHYRRQETSGGIEFAMPAAPVLGPGVWFTVWVPASEQERVEQIIEDLRLERKKDPGVWDLSPTPRGRKRKDRLIPSLREVGPPDPGTSYR